MHLFAVLYAFVCFVVIRLSPMDSSVDDGQAPLVKSIKMEGKYNNNRHHNNNDNDNDNDHHHDVV